MYIWWITTCTRKQMNNTKHRKLYQLSEEHRVAIGEVLIGRVAIERQKAAVREGVTGAAAVQGAEVESQKADCCGYRYG